MGGGSTSQGVTHMAGKLVLALGVRPHPPQEASAWAATPRARVGEPGGSCPFDDPPEGIGSAPFWSLEVKLQV